MLREKNLRGILVYEFSAFILIKFYADFVTTAAQKVTFFSLSHPEQVRSAYEAPVGVHLVFADKQSVCSSRWQKLSVVILLSTIWLLL